MQIKWMLLTLAALVGLGGDARAQQPTAVDITSELRSIASQPTDADGDRATVRSFLDRPDVRAAAESMGIDLTGTTANHVSALSDAEAAALATRLAALPGEPQVGGQVIVISASAVIIALLILLLLSD